jgi:hypothetical protein
MVVSLVAFGCQSTNSLILRPPWLHANLKLKQTNAVMESLREGLEGKILAGSFGFATGHAL